MPAQWTTEQVLALAPDAASAKSGRGLAIQKKWLSLGMQQSAVWGECQGSGKTPYRTQIDLSEPAFRCSCPSRKFPCKHGLGLFLLLAEQPDIITEVELPDWVAEWLTGRSQRQEKTTQKAKQSTVDPKAQTKRATARQEKISAGIQELRLWLEDRVRQGLATVPQDSYQVWDAIAARMVDAQAPGLARRLREMAGIAHTGEGWCDRLLEQMGRLYLLLDSYERLESLPPAVQADLRTQIGWTLTQEEVLTGAAEADRWCILGQRTETEENLKVRRTWLWGLSSEKSVLLLDFAQGHRTFEQVVLPGSCMDAELVFYPSAYPLRAVIKTRQETAPIAKPPPGSAAIAEAIALYSRAFATCPWLDHFPLMLDAVTPMRVGDRWLLRDTQGAILPLSNRLEPTSAWQLLALSGGHPVAVLGEWDGMQLMPLSVWVEDSFYGLGN